MSEESERWKEKYLKSIERQEKLERRWAARLDLLRRGLVRSTLAAEGSDRAVDQCMKEMREVVRTDDMDAALAGLIPRLEKAVLDSEQRREVRVEQIGSALNALVTQLQSLPLSRDVSRPLKKFAKGLDERAGQAREIPLLLGELSKLQGDALSQLEPAEHQGRPGLLQRLFGGRETEPSPLPGLAGPAAGAEVPPAPAASAEPSPPAAVLAIPADSPGLPAEQAPGLPLEVLVVAAPANEHGDAAAASAPEGAMPAVPPAADAQQEGPSTGPQQVDVETSAPDAPQAEASKPLAPAPGAQTLPSPAPEPTSDTAGALPNGPDASSASPALPVISRAPLPVFLDSLPLPAVMAEAFAAVDPDAPAEDILYALPDAPEPSYSSVATHIEDTLLGLLNDLSVPERHQSQADDLKSRLEHGLNWYELLPILDDLAVLMLAVSDGGQHEFETYLQELNRRLESFQSQLRETSDGHADNQSVAREMDNELREQVDGLQSDVKGATDVDSLKNILDSRLEGLLGTLDAHQQQRDLREQEVAGRLQALADRVSTMETEALGYREHLEEQRQKALVDPLTNLPNRAAWSEELDQQVQAWQTTGDDLLLAMLDLDHFKAINDNYGHQAGDKVLKIIASQLARQLRPGDFIARYGGEEFVLMMPRTALADGVVVLEGIREVVQACPFHFKGERVTITVSMGVAAFKAHDRSEAVLKRADQALYKAKEAGRNCVIRG